MDVEQLKKDAAAGKLGAEQLVKVIVAQQERIAELEAEIAGLQQQLGGKRFPERLEESYSEEAETKRKSRKNRRKRRRGLKRGRVSTKDKIKLAERTEVVYPAGISPKLCTLSHTRVAWRLESGRAVLVA